MLHLLDNLPKPLAGFRGPEPAAPGGRNRQAERRKSQGAPFMARLCEFPGLIVLQAGPGGSPAFPYREAIRKKAVREQGEP